VDQNDCVEELPMVEIEFSVMESVTGAAQNLRPLLDAFEKQHHIHVDLTPIHWKNGWAEIAKFGIYAHGPDVSSIGTTWIGSLAAGSVILRSSFAHLIVIL